jgi:hypothetical protein
MFGTLDPLALAVWAARRGEETSLDLPEPSLRIVIEALAGLQDHFARVEAALRDAAPESERAART